MQILESHIVPEGVLKVRLSDYAYKIFELMPTRKGMKKAIKRGEIFVDGEKGETGTWINSGQIIELVDLEKKERPVYELAVDVIYEDDYLAVIKKPAGIAVSGNKFRTIFNALPFNLKKSEQKDALKYPKPMHRLDKPTSGLLLIAKTTRAAINLGKQFEKGKIKKRYRAIVIGKIEKSGTIKTKIESRNAITTYNSVRCVPSLKNRYLSLVDLFPITGRTHQLRIHLSSIGFPILGDKIYGKEGLILKHKGLFLSAVELSFFHPFTLKPVKVGIDEPYKFGALLERELARVLFRCS